MALSRMHVKAQSRRYMELRAEATPVAIWRNIVDFSRLQAASDCGGLRVNDGIRTMSSDCCIFRCEEAKCLTCTNG